MILPHWKHVWAITACYGEGFILLFLLLIRQLILILEQKGNAQPIMHYVKEDYEEFMYRATSS
jgi:hypothetical protein